MPSYKTDRPFSDEELKYMDVIHNPNTTLFKDQYEPSYTINNFITDDERLKLLSAWDDSFDTNGEIVNTHIYRLVYPMKVKLISDIIRPKIYEEFGEDTIFYSDIAGDDPMSVGDQMFKAVRPYGLHTDAVTHLDGYRPYKDIIIPLMINGPGTYVTFEQRYRGHATMFMNGRHIASFANYHNVIKKQSYKEYGVENIKDDNSDHQWLEHIMPKHIPLSIYDGLSIEDVHPWEHCNAIVQDTSVLHAPTEFKDSKIGLTLHLMKKDDSYKNSITGHYTPWSPYTRPVIPI